MFKKISLIILAVVVVFVVVVLMQPNDFRVSRSATINADAAKVFSLVNDFHNWEAWSPWAKLDPAAKNSFEGPSSGEGAIFRWDGNKDVGVGSMTIADSVSPEIIKIKLDFIKPFKGTNDVEFDFKSESGKTVVTWTMAGKNNFISKAISLFMDCEKIVGDMFDKGLANMKSVAERSS